MARDDDDTIPPCYGDEDEYKPDTDEWCKACDLQDACGAEIRRQRRKRVKRRSTRRGSSSAKKKRSTTSKSRRRRDDDDERSPEVDLDTSFWHALTHNSMLEAMGAMLREGWYSVTQIPRIKYRSPWDIDDDEGDEDDD